jgi:hypothetical protein
VDADNLLGDPNCTDAAHIGSVFAAYRGLRLHPATMVVATGCNSQHAHGRAGLAVGAIAAARGRMGPTWRCWKSPTGRPQSAASAGGDPAARSHLRHSIGCVQPTSRCRSSPPPLALLRPRSARSWLGAVPRGAGMNAARRGPVQLQTAS